MTRRDKINVLVADGRKLLREGLCLLLEKHEGLSVIAEADEARAAVKLVRALPVQVVVLNHSLAKPDDVDVVRCIHRANPAVSVVVLANRPSANRVREMLEAGASACLNKESATAELVAAIQAARNGKVYLSPGLVHSVVTAYVQPAGGDGTPVKAKLAPREREILGRIADGQHTKQIAADLKVGTKTVETLRRRIMEKLDLYTVADLTKHAIREGLTSLEPRV